MMDRQIARPLADHRRFINANERGLREIAEDAPMAQRPRERLFAALEALTRATANIEEAVTYIDPENADELLDWEPQETEPTDTVKAAGLNMARPEAMNPEAEAHYRLQALSLAGSAKTVAERIRRATQINDFVLYGKEPNDG